MRKPLIWLMRGLGVGHFVWGLLFVLIAAHTIYSAFAVLPYMSSGTVWSNLPTAILLAIPKTPVSTKRQ
jgi:hypothetical protein